MNATDVTKRIFLLIGAPGIGKTTVLFNAVEMLKAQGISVGGMISREVRETGVRVGFEILDLTNGKTGWLAHINQTTGPQVGKYHVKLADLNNVGAMAILEALKKCQVIVIDEVGPMELFSEIFKHAVKLSLDDSKPVLAVVHAKAKDPLITVTKEKADSEILNVTLNNRNKIAQELVERIIRLLKIN